MHSTADTPATHPIVLHGDLFAEDERAPQTQFVPERQVAFLEALAVSGSVRGAARRARVSHQTCYRARRNSAAFGRAWDAALVIARGAAEAKLADFAMHGVDEEVWYHGELVGTRRRFSDRLLLAHLARLDRMRTDARIEALAEGFDAMLRRLRAGEAIDADLPAATPETSSHGPCNTRSMSPAQGEPDAVEEPACDCVGARLGTDRGKRHYRIGADGWEPVPNVGKATGPCCEEPDWPGCRDCPHYPRVSRLIEEMEEARPADAPTVAELTGAALAIEACQMAAFEAGDEDWWRYGEGWALHTRDEHGMWVAEEESQADAGT
ncbi:hypothetical protein K3172_11380 [Qipengyuania sp. 6B39]|uniref:hypothetical protein n=1 Tax=Qipengyuania proteolytica TaxID=2867239 RepID=UPI001C8AAE44|nr:hypothetical protein [Qipengyuania proteolytica]MBX7496456.1 hypothetical protein [Qipengyuania proteolytica]